MARVTNIEKQVSELSSMELAEFREWFAHFDAEVWDQQFEAHVNAGKLDALAEHALKEHAAGLSAKL